MQSATKLKEETTPDNGWPAAQRFAITEELKSVLKDPTFNHSKRCMALLRWLVERSLAKDCDGLKERTVGMAVFGRSADYDTNNDPIVRMAANEVRKRLAMYYQNPNARRSVVRIRLVPGSYIPEFDFHSSDLLAESDASETEASEAPNWETKAMLADSAEPLAADSLQAAHYAPGAHKLEDSGAGNNTPRLADNRPTTENSPLTVPAPLIKKTRNVRLFTKRWHALVGAALLLVIIAASTAARLDIFQTSQHMAWAPLLESKTPPIICLSEAAYLPSVGGAASQRNATANEAPAPTPSYYSFEDLNVAHKVSLWLASHDTHLSNYGTQVSLRRPHDISLWEFRHQPVVLVGAADNFWASALLSSLRFTPRRDPVTGVLSIRDSKNPARLNFVQSGPTRDNSTVDYAIVTRYRDPDTGNWIFSFGGLGPHGTEAAGQLMIDPYFAKDFPSEVRSKNNFQIIVKTIAINGKTGIPQIVDFYAW